MCRVDRAVGVGVLALTLAGWAAAEEAVAPDPVRAATLVHVVRQDCGSCHGLHLTGGLGPALTSQALADYPLDSLVAVILNGRPGTPMPGWRGLISERDAYWIAQQLKAGFPPAKDSP